MQLFSTERKLRNCVVKLEAKQTELAIAQEQLAALKDELDDARIRALVSETPSAEMLWQEHAKHLVAYERDEKAIKEQIIELQARKRKLES